MQRRLNIIALVMAMSCGPILSEANDSQSIDYLRDIKPIFKERCFSCHGALKQEGGLRLDTAALIRQGGESGLSVPRTDAKRSLLIERVSASDESNRMPPEGEPLTPKQIQLLRAWIIQGAHGPKDEQPEVDPRKHWAFQRIERPTPPIRAFRDQRSAGDVGCSPQNEIDAFIAAQAARAKLTVQPSAPKHVLLRRVYLDLIGVPPTREELRAFLADNSPSAYETVIDRLLSDPRYGERWARHWMDVWRYSDWYGRRHVPDVWNSAPQIWRWRDWIVDSLNQDHGYDRMLEEMLAADEIAPQDDQAGYATGYLIRNWYALNPNDWMRSTVEHTGKAFLGLTFNCAHCHDHKYDPIEQVDYFRLRAFFEPMYIRQDRVAGESDPGPFEDYVYGKVRKIQRLGAVRIFDKTPDATTWFYNGGDERNRVRDLGSIAPGVPKFLTESLGEINPVDLPPRAWYPGLRPGIQATIVADAKRKIAASELAMDAARKSVTGPSPATREQLAKAEQAYESAARDAQQTQSLGALVGKQSLFFDATQGRRVVQNRLPGLRAFESGFSIEFRLQLLTDAHFNFQLAKDVVKGLTAGYVAFDQGRIVSYQPDSFQEFDVGSYDYGSGQNRFDVKLTLNTQSDSCLLSVRSLHDDTLVVDKIPVALNGWNPVGDPTKGISFDARTGSVAAIDELTLTLPTKEKSGTDSGPVRAARFDFEPPAYANGRDIAGLEGWEASRFSVAPAYSLVSSTALNSQLRRKMQELRIAQQAIERAWLPLQIAEAKVEADRAELTSITARIAADRATYGETSDANVDELTRSASRSEREANLRRAETAVLIQKQSLATAETAAGDDAKRKQATAAATTKELQAAEAAVESARQALADEKLAEAYQAFSPTYPTTSTGRRRALAQWITGRDNPMTARVAINHIWARHFHAPLVTTVQDFGRNGDPPSHPLLLDWLAVELMESGWSMKHIHRLIVSSAAYRRTTTMKGTEQCHKQDPENRWLWRMNTGRLEAEVVRDSLLYCAGKLDLRMGGQELENSESLTTNRRSLYYSYYPEQGGKSPLGELFDGPNPLECYRRTRTIIPQQALALTNSDLVHAASISIVKGWDAQEHRKHADARRLLKNSSTYESNNALHLVGDGGRFAPGEISQHAARASNSERFIVEMFETILTREPTDAEVRVCLDAISTSLAAAATDKPAAITRARESLVRVLLNHNDFVTIR